MALTQNAQAKSRPVDRLVTQVLGGKKFNPDEKTFDKTKHYGKRILAEKVSKDQASINFAS
uniref:hypothetical protein n=1 Tax=Yoonia sp. TaxID=2212373 RepID=UPI0040475CCD